MSAREVLMFCRETSYGVPDLTTGAPTTGSFGYIRLDQGNAFSMVPAPVRQRIAFGGGFNVPALNVGVGATCVGTLRTHLYRSQAATLLGWALTRIPTGRALPWPTTDAGSVMPPGDLASLSLYRGIYDNGGTLRREAFRGVKASSVRVSGSEGSPIVTVEFGLIAQKPDPNSRFGGPDADPIDATEFPLPDGDDYPTDPYLFQHSALKYGASNAADYSGFTLSVTNTLKPHRFETAFLRRCVLHGREIGLAVPLLYKSTPDYRADYENQAEKDVELTLDDGTGAAKFDLHGRAILPELPYDTPLDDDFMVNASFTPLYDGAESSDFAFSYVEA